jgi:uncharacterized protein Yka (UPF0111/DUF47 family)
MDDVVDSMYGAIERLYIFHVEEMRPEATHIAQITVESVDEMRTMLAHLPHFHHEKHLMDYVLHIDDLEDKGDDTYHDALSHLFAGGVDPIEVIRWTDIFNKMEDATDACEASAYVVQGVIIKNA